MTDNTIIADEESLDAARRLISELEAGNGLGVNECLDLLSHKREQGLFQELGKLTRDLHDALRNFQLDTRMANMTESEIPDAKERLRHVIEMTEQAANRTLNSVEAGLPIAEDLKSRSIELRDKWQRFRSRDMQVSEFRDLVPELDEFLEFTAENAVVLNNRLSEILMAQDFQDLTGQIIRRVINLVTEVEDGLVELIRVSGAKIVAPSEEAKQSADSDRHSQGYGPQLKGIDDVGEAEIVSGQDEVDDLLSSLGF